MKVAAIQVRGGMNISPTVRKTSKLLKLTRKNSCVILNSDQITLGMLVALKDYITWGEIDEPTLKLLLEKRARLAGNKLLTEEYLKKHSNMAIEQLAKSLIQGKIKLKEIPGLKTYFRLTPPRGGYEKKGIKTQYSIGGALCYSKD